MSRTQVFMACQDSTTLSSRGMPAFRKIHRERCGLPPGRRAARVGRVSRGMRIAAQSTNTMGPNNGPTKFQRGLVMSHAKPEGGRRVESDRLLQEIADYALSYRIDSPEAWQTARYCLLDALGCGLLALGYPAC